MTASTAGRTLSLLVERTEEESVRCLLPARTQRREKGP